MTKPLRLSPSLDLASTIDDLPVAKSAPAAVRDAPRVPPCRDLAVLLAPPPAPGPVAKAEPQFAPLVPEPNADLAGHVLAKEELAKRAGAEKARKAAQAGAPVAKAAPATTVADHIQDLCHPGTRTPVAKAAPPCRYPDFTRDLARLAKSAPSSSGRAADVQRIAKAASTPEELARRKKKATARLTQMDTREVSAVDRAAIGEPWVVKKNAPTTANAPAGMPVRKALRAGYTHGADGILLELFC